MGDGTVTMTVVESIVDLKYTPASGAQRGDLGSDATLIAGID